MDILFYCFKNVHLPIFAPVAKAVRKLNPSAQLLFAAPAQNSSLREGISDEERDGFARETGARWVGDGSGIRADVAVMADCVADRLQGHGRIVNLGHGLISKGQYFGAESLVGRENLADEICVPGPWHAEQLRRHLYIPVHVTGMSKLDALFTEFDATAFRLANGLPIGIPVLLWCPTFNMELSSIPVLWTQAKRLTQFGHLVVKMHGTTDPFLVRGLREGLADDSNVHVLDPSADPTPYMRVADLMVTDVSSVMFEFAALDRPLVLVDNPHQSAYRNYDPEDVEYTMRDIGERVTDVEGVVQAVKRCLEDPTLHSQQRQAATAAMFAATDGKNSERIARVLLDRPELPGWKHGYDLVFPAHFGIREIEFCSQGLSGFRNIYGPPLAGAPNPHPLYRMYRSADELSALLAKGGNPNLLVFRRPCQLAGDWLAPLFGPLYLAEDPMQVTGPLSAGKIDPFSHVLHHLKLGRFAMPENLDLPTLARIVRFTNPGEWARVPVLGTAVFAVRRNTVLAAGISCDALSETPALRKAVVSDCLVRE